MRRFSRAGRAMQQWSSRIGSVRRSTLTPAARLARPFLSAPRWFQLFLQIVRRPSVTLANGDGSRCTARIGWTSVIDSLPRSAHGSILQFSSDLAPQAS